MRRQEQRTMSPISNDEAMIVISRDTKNKVKIQAAKKGMTMKDYIKQLVEKNNE